MPINLGGSNTMIQKIATQIINIFERNDVMEHEREIYQHGLELTLSYMVGFLIQIGFCIITGFWVETFLFIVFFESLRKYTGGYHATTYFSCNVFYLFLYGVYYVMMTCLKIPPLINGVSFLIAAIFIIMYAPVTHIHNPLDQDEKVKYRNITILLLLGYSFLIVLFYFIFPYYMQAIAIPTCMNAIFMGLGLVFNERGEV